MYFESVVFKEGDIAVNSFKEFSDLRSKVRFFLTLKENLKTVIRLVVLFIESEDGRRMTIAQCKTDRRVFRDLRLSFTPVFDQGNVAWALPGITSTLRKPLGVSFAQEFFFSQDQMFWQI